jgi:hypothetical protein
MACLRWLTASVVKQVGDETSETGALVPHGNHPDREVGASAERNSWQQRRHETRVLAEGRR